MSISMHSASVPVFTRMLGNLLQWLDKAEEAGVVAFLSKPFGEQSLLSAISLACDKMEGPTSSMGRIPDS